VVIYTTSTGLYQFFLLGSNPTVLKCLSDTVNAQYDVTAMDSTYFYVGNATDYAQSGNATGNTYYWVALP
jgi:hypothetical protein